MGRQTRGRGLAGHHPRATVPAGTGQGWIGSSGLLQGPTHGTSVDKVDGVDRRGMVSGRWCQSDDNDGKQNTSHHDGVQQKCSCAFTSR